MKKQFGYMTSILSVLIANLAALTFVQVAKAQGHEAADRAVRVAFEKKQISLAGKTFTVEVADTFDRRERGLMFRDHLPDNTGMLFIFEQEQRVSFWMKNTLIPLSIGYFDKDQKLREVHEMLPAVMGERNPKTYPSSVAVIYALEMPKGWFKRNTVMPGSKFSFTSVKQK